MVVRTLAWVDVVQLLVVFSRVGVYIRVPGVDVDRFAESMRSGAGLLGYIDQLSGGSISKVGVFSLGAPLVTPFCCRCVTGILHGMLQVQLWSSTLVSQVASCVKGSSKR